MFCWMKQGKQGYVLLDEAGEAGVCFVLWHNIHIKRGSMFRNRSTLSGTF